MTCGPSDPKSRLKIQCVFRPVSDFRRHRPDHLPLCFHSLGSPFVTCTLPGVSSRRRKVVVGGAHGGPRRGHHGQCSRCVIWEGERANCRSAKSGHATTAAEPQRSQRTALPSLQSAKRAWHRGTSFPPNYCLFTGAGRKEV